ncbi:MAG: TonB-dependent receptor [Prevotella sp.]|nr:TonB-dependent receptor [Prevotella sp.]
MRQMRFLCVTIMLMATSIVMGQNTTVKGVLMDKGLGESEPYATVRIFKQGKTDKPVAMFLTDGEGRFKQEVKGEGTFDLVVSSIGKEELKKSIVLGKDKVLDLDTLYIMESASTLKGVEIVAQKPLVKMEVDKMSYDVSEDADAKSATVLDMLRKVPMVTVDGQDNISVNGSSSFKVYVDGKPNVMFSSNPSMVFKNMPASAVKNIEVITNPGAKYDAEGAAGVLNIVMNRTNPAAKESLNGYNGSVRASVGNRSIGGGAYLSGQQGKFSYSANVNENYSKPGTTKVEMEQENGDGNILTTAETKVKLPFTMGNVSLGYELDSMSSVSATLSLTSMNMRNEGTTTTNMHGGNYGSAFGYGNDLNMKNKRTSFSGTVDYQRFFNKEHTQWLAFTYQLSMIPSENEQRNRFNTASTSFIDLTDRYSMGKEHTTDHTFQTDYTMPIGIGQTLNVGGKLMLRRANSDSKYYLKDVYDEASSMDYLYKNSILAGYTEYEGKWGNIGTKAGLRYEHTWQNVEYRLGNGTDFETNYGSLVPSASLSYSFSPTSNIGLTYNMRISRPGITYLNPYVDKSDPTALTYGNTNLDVEKAHNISLVYNMFTPKLMLNVNLHHNFTDNAIEQYSFFDNTLLNTTYGNIVKRHQTGVNVYANWLATKNTRLFVNGSVNYLDLRSNELSASNSGWTTSTMVGLQQTLPWNLKMGAYLMNSTKSYTLQGWSNGFNLVTANLSKSFFDDKLSIGVMGLMGLSKGGDLKMESYSKGSQFLSHQTISVPISSISLNVTYTFGNTKKQMKQHVSRVQNDYIEQQSQGEVLNSVGNVQQ